MLIKYGKLRKNLRLSLVLIFRLKESFNKLWAP